MPSCHVPSESRVEKLYQCVRSRTARVTTGNHELLTVFVLTVQLIPANDGCRGIIIHDGFCAQTLSRASFFIHYSVPSRHDLIPSYRPKFMVKHTSVLQNPKPSARASSSPKPNSTNFGRGAWLHEVPSAGCLGRASCTSCTLGEHLLSSAPSPST